MAVRELDPATEQSLRRVVADLDHLAGLSAPGPGVTRLGFSREDAEARRWFERECLQAGLRFEMDTIGNCFGWSPAAEGARPLLIGSHLDSVIQGGAYDGIVGVVVGLEVARRVVAERPDLPIGVVSFACEESTRFGIGCVGSRYLMGELTEEVMAGMRDRHGLSLEEVLAGAELRPTRRIMADDGFIHSFLEVHIDQGTILSSSGYGFGLVNNIVGVHRTVFTFVGEVSHSGGRRRSERRDALLAAAEFVLQADAMSEESESDQSSLLVTVGKLDVYPNSPNTVPGRVALIVDLRCSDRHQGEHVLERLDGVAREIGRRRDIAVERDYLGGTSPTAMDRRMVEVLAETAAELGLRQRPILSLAGHDAMELAKRYPVAMILIGNPTGMSHSPEESFDERGVGEAIRLVLHAIPRLLSIPPTGRTIG